MKNNKETFREVAFNVTSLSNQVFHSDRMSLFYYYGVNKDSSPITIVRSKPSCGCTTVIADKNIGGNEKFTITLSIDKKGQRGYTALSAKVFYIFDNDPTQEEHEFLLAANGQIK